MRVKLKNFKMKNKRRQEKIRKLILLTWVMLLGAGVFLTFSVFAKEYFGYKCECPGNEGYEKKGVYDMEPLTTEEISPGKMVEEANMRCLNLCGNNYKIPSYEVWSEEDPSKTFYLCTDETKCPEGLECSKQAGAATGKCVQKGKGCTSSNECSEGQICYQNECVTGKKPEELGEACSDDTVCENVVGKGSVCYKGPGGESAFGGRCTKLPKGELTNIECELDSDCAKAFNNAGAKCEGVKRTSDGTLLEKGRCTKGTKISELDTGPSEQFTPAGEATLENPLGNIDLLNLIGKRIIPGLLGVIGTVAVAAIIWGGFTYVVSRGNEKTMEAAKATITYAIIGLLLAIISWIIINTVVTALTG